MNHMNCLCDDGTEKIRIIGHEEELSRKDAEGGKQSEGQHSIEGGQKSILFFKELFRLSPR